MIEMSLQQVATELGGELYGDNARFKRVSTDSRSIAAGELFVALCGDNFDAHVFLQDVVKRGACGAVVQQFSEHVDIPQVVVEDTRIGLGRLARAWRLKMQGMLIALTGSNGKTTVKEMIASILSERGTVLSTAGNLNNDIGMPLTLLRQQGERYSVIEMGANHAGEIAYLTNIARPDFVLLNNAAEAHLEGFGSLEGVAKAKGEIISEAGPETVVVINADDRFAPLWRKLAGNRQCIGFGCSDAADVRLLEESATTEWNEQGFVNRFRVAVRDLPAASINLRLAGKHNRMNAAAAAAVCHAMGMTINDIQHGLQKMTPVAGRLQTRFTSEGLCLIDDTYNANPGSVSAAIDVLASAPGKKILVLGELAELGSDARSMHEKIGAYAAGAGIDSLYTVGEGAEAAAESFTGVSVSCGSHDEAIAELLTEVEPITVLVKGSRSSRMECVVDALLQAWEGEHVC